MLKFRKLLFKILGAGLVGYAALFAVFWFDLDGKALYYIVEPFLVKHYESMKREDATKTPYDMDKYPKYEYKVD